MVRNETRRDRRSGALAYLAGHHVMSLATHGPDGPWAAALFYVNDGFNLAFLSSAESRHADNFARNARAAAAIHEDYEDWPDIKGLQIEGSVRILTGSERVYAMARYARKYPIARPDSAPAAIRAALGRVAWYELSAERCFFVDNSQGFGHRDEIDLR